MDLHDLVTRQLRDQDQRFTRAVLVNCLRAAGGSLALTEADIYDPGLFDIELQMLKYDDGRMVLKVIEPEDKTK